MLYAIEHTPDNMKNVNRQNHVQPTLSKITFLKERVRVPSCNDQIFPQMQINENISHPLKEGPSAEPKSRVSKAFLVLEMQAARLASLLAQSATATQRQRAIENI